MNISKLTGSELTDRLKKLVQTERKITHLVLECIVEIDRRRLYADRAYSSLYEFLVREYGYSPSAANRRIESARLLSEIPDLAPKIENGSLSLSQLSKAQQAIRTAQKIHSTSIATADKRTILKKIENTNQAETDVILAMELDLPVQKIEKTVLHADGSVTVSTTFSKEQMQTIVQARNSHSNASSGPDWCDFFYDLAKKELKHREPSSEKRKRTAADGAQDPASSPHPKKISSRHRKLLLKNAHCQFVDQETSKVCGSRRYLEIDHIQPRWAGGGNEIANLRVLCRTHNQLRYQKEAGLSRPPPP